MTGGNKFVGHDDDDDDGENDDGSNWHNADWCNSELHFLKGKPQIGLKAG